MVKKKMVERCSHSTMSKLVNDLLESAFLPYPSKLESVTIQLEFDLGTF